HGFKNIAEYEAVAASISLEMAAIDSQTKVFTDPPTAIRQELEDVTAAKNILKSEKKKLLRSLTLALRAARPIQFPTNVELVQKYYDKIDVTEPPILCPVSTQRGGPAAPSAGNARDCKTEGHHEPGMTLSLCRRSRESF